MEHKYYLGVDGGGTKTAFALINEQKELIYLKEVGPSSLDTVDEQQIINVIYEGTKDINVKVDSIFLGIGGIYCQEQIDWIKEIVSKLDIVKKETKIDAGNDIISAFYGALSGEDGIVCIAGTGSVCYAKNKDQNIRIGGINYMEGDPGSAYDLGIHALRYLAKVIDYRKKGGPFADALKDATKINNYEDITKYFIEAKRTDIASLAKLVTENSNDINAKKIIKDSVNELLLMIKTAFKKLHFEGETKISIIGSLGNSDTSYKTYLLEGIKKISPNLKFVQKTNEAYIGSALKAMEL